MWNRLFGDQPLNGDPQPTLYMNPTTPVRLQGYRIAFPGYLPWSPGSAIPFGGPQQLFQLYQDQTWLKGKHDFRFGGSFVRISDDRTFGAYANSVESLNTTSNALISLNNFVQGQILRFQTAINPNGFPGGTYTTPVSLPELQQQEPLQRVCALLQRQLVDQRPGDGQPGPPVRVLRSAAEERPQVRLELLLSERRHLGQHGKPDRDHRGAAQRPRASTNEGSPIGALWASDWNNFAPRVGFAWDLKGDGTTSVRGGYGMAYERNFGNVTYNVLFNPPLYLVASIDAPTDVASLPIYTDPAGPVRRCRRRHQADSGRQPAARRSEYRDRLRTLLRPRVPASGLEQPGWPRGVLRLTGPQTLRSGR